MVKKYFWRDARGRPCVRIKGRRYPLRDAAGNYHELDTPEGDRLYWEIMTGKRADSKRSWGAMIGKLRSTDKWASLSPRYRSDLEPVLQYLDEKIGKQPVTALTPAHIYKAMDANKHRVRFANYIPVAISMLSRLARRDGWRADNPAADIEKMKVPKSRQMPHTPPTDAEVQIWREKANHLPRLIFEIGVGSVQRPSDWLGFTWGDYDGACLKLTQNKTGVRLMLPCTEYLRSALDAERAKLTPLPTRPILCKADGQPMNYHALARVMRNERKRLGTTGHDNHGLRYRGVMELAWAGCTDDEIAAYSGHSTRAMIQKYAGDARQIMRARQAHEKRR